MIFLHFLFGVIKLLVDYILGRRLNINQRVEEM